MGNADVDGLVERLKLAAIQLIERERGRLAGDPGSLRGLLLEIELAASGEISSSTSYVTRRFAPVDRHQTAADRRLAGRL